MDITKELEETVDLSAEWKGRTINYTVAKASLTPGFLQGIEKIAYYPKALAGCLRSWDLEAHGEMYPIDEESVAKLPADFLSTLIDRIGESWSGEKKSNANSASG